MLYTFKQLMDTFEMLAAETCSKQMKPFVDVLMESRLVPEELQ
jgi:hypothetical protein